MATITAEAILGEPCPRVGITVRGLAAGSHKITVWRTCEGERVAVRSARGRVVIDSTYVEDFEAPLNRPVMYHLEVLSGASATTIAAGAGVTLRATSGYVQDPLDPWSAVPVNAGPQGDEAFFTPESFESFTYDASVSRFAVLGSNRPVAIAGQRQAATGVTLSMVTTDPDANTRLRDLVLQAPLLIVRPLPEWGRAVPATATYTAASVAERPLRHAIGGVVTRWETTGDVVRGSSARVLNPTWAYQRVRELYSTYEQKQLTSGGGSYLDDIKNPSNV